MALMALPHKDPLDRFIFVVILSPARGARSASFITEREKFYLQRLKVTFRLLERCEAFPSRLGGPHESTRTSDRTQRTARPECSVRSPPHRLLTMADPKT
jgi:hypothetical protein